MADATTDKPAAKRKPRAKPAAESNGSAPPSAQRTEKGTDFVTFVQATDDNDALIEAVKAGRVWVEQSSQVRSVRGDAGIKATNLRDDGAVEPGTYKAVPASTWNAEANNLIVGGETKFVNQFSKPGQ